MNMNLDLGKLNEKQREAATTTEGPLLLLAGAGSGKTQTMTYRIAYLLSQGVSPYNILAVTFTNKAAKEMRERVEKLAGSTSAMWIMTFHAMSLRILREHYDKIGYEKNFVVYDTVDQKQLIKNICKEQDVDTKAYPVNYVLSIISKQKEQDRSPEEFFKIEGSNPHTKVLFDIYKAYQTQLKKNNAMDFDDLLVYCLHILRDEAEVRFKYQKRFEYVMVDEYQDTNRLQYEIVTLISGGYDNLCVVGDDDQCIYQWRGADIRNILDFENDYPNAKVIKLEQNYRSYGNILKAAHSVIKNNMDRKEKELWTDKDAGHKIVYSRLDNDKEEAEYVAQEIKILKNRYEGFNDFAVLYRTNAQSRLFEDALRKRDIPYKVLSGFSFYDRKETKDMISYLRLVVNPKDDVALKRIINEPKRGIGGTTQSKIESCAEMFGCSMLEVLMDQTIDLGISKKAEEAVRGLGELILLCQREKENLKVSDIYDSLLVKSGYLKALEDENTLDSEGRIENLLDFKSFIYDYEKEKEEIMEEATLEEFLERVSTNSQQDGYDEESGTVTLMTMHSAKGLEFPVVFLPGMEDGLFPGYRAQDDQDEMEEERRLCYVGMTRAKERLFLTSASYRVMFGHGDYTRESQFLRELDPSVLDESGDSVYVPSQRTRNQSMMDTGSFDGFGPSMFRGEQKTSPFGYDPVQHAKEALKENARKNETQEFSIGDKVSHSKFGVGTVTNVTTQIVTIDFEEVGQKKLAIGLAPIKKI